MFFMGGFASVLRSIPGVGTIASAIDPPSRPSVRVVGGSLSDSATSSTATKIAPIVWIGLGLGVIGLLFFAFSGDSK
jgi:hypothetical protein